MKHYDVVAVGAGVTGTAFISELCRYGRGIGRMALIEKYAGPALVNSNPANNAQTSHAGDTETNYTLAHALEVQRAATALRTYVSRRNAPGLFRKTSRMVLGVGEDEVRQLNERFIEFKPHYSDLTLAGPNELWELEPNVMKGRDPNEPVIGLVSSEGYAVNYKRLAECFIEDAVACRPDSLDLLFNTEIRHVQRVSSGYVLITNKGMIRANVVVFAAGAFSLHFAHQLGIGTEFAILSIAGNFYDAGPQLRGKVYRVQIPGMPFAAIHGDRDVLFDDRTRFGPTTLPIALMERHRLKTMVPYFGMGWLSRRGAASIVRILRDRQLLGYAIKNWSYTGVPYLGHKLLLKEVRKIVPSLRSQDLTLIDGAGGSRPQLVNLDTRELIMGDMTLVGDGVIFNTTPSPGASVCLGNAERDAARVVEMLGSGAFFDQKAFERDHGLA